MSNIAEIDCNETASLIESGSAVLIDVREPFENASASIPGAVLMPLGSLDPGAVRERAQGKRVVFHCKAGVRSMDAARKYAESCGECASMKGGIDAWKAAGRPTERSASAPPIDVMRQVQITAGSLVLLGVVLSLAVHPGFVGLSGFVGAGLVFAGASGWCGMAKLLALMPWNRVPTGAGGSSATLSTG